MGFQTGTQIRPELGNADYSGFARAAEIHAEAMDDLGRQIGQGIQKYKKKKQDAADDEAFVQAVEPYLMGITGGDPDEARAMAKYLRKDPATFNAIQSLRQREAEEKKNKVTQSILNQFSQGNISAQEAFAMGVDPASIKAVSGITEGQTAKQFAESVALAAESVGGTYDPAQRAIIVDESMIPFYGEKSIPLSDPMFEPYFATAKGRTMTGRGFDVLGTYDYPPVAQEEYVPNAPVSLPEAQSSPSNIGSSLSSMSGMDRPDAATSILQSAESPMFVEPTLSASDVASGAVSRMSDFFKRKLKENEAMRQSTYGL